MKAVILASGVSRPRKTEKSSMGFAENFEVLQFRQRLLAHWRNLEHPYQHDFLRTKHSLKKRSVRNPVKRSWMKDFENETSDSLRGKLHPSSAPSGKMAGR
jgi:hypothetical protein